MTVTYTGTDDTTIPGPPPTQTEALLSTIPPERLEWAITVGATLASRAGDLYAALEDIALSNTARPAIEIVTEVALSAVE